VLQVLKVEHQHLLLQDLTRLLRALHPAASHQQEPYLPLPPSSLLPVVVDEAKWQLELV
jgi:hypothetical protein